MSARRYSPDLIAIAALILLWLWFFWRLFTPMTADQASLAQGDFSGQFVAFAAYQYDRLTQGQIPLWNPYNNGGFPFIADTQAAVFYLPRWITIGLAHLAGGFSYRALEWEMTAHILFYSISMYILVRRLTLHQAGSPAAAFLSAVIAAYSGFMSGYPPLQLAILEASAWLPFALLGIHEATRPEFGRLRWAWLALTGAAFGLSWLAGHPQSSFFMTWLLTAYLGWRIYTNRWRWTHFVSGTAFFGTLAFGLAAVQLLPGVEYLRLTTRPGFGFDAKGNGFPIQDVLQFIYPNVVSQFSPLYVGLVGLSLATIALLRKASNAFFWGAVIFVALLWSLGANGPLYPLIYNLLPGAYFFRGQERAAFIVSFGLAVLAGLGLIQLLTWSREDTTGLRRLRSGLRLTAVAVAAPAVGVWLLWLGNRDAYAAYVPNVILSALIAAALVLLLPHIPGQSLKRWAVFALLGMLVIELFTANMDAPAVYDPVPPNQQLSMTPPPLVERILTDGDTPFRVDGFRGLGDNYGSLYGVADIHGISPLWLGSASTLIQGAWPPVRAWEVFAVRYVMSDWNELPVASEILAQGADRYGSINLHRLNSPRPFVHFVDRIEVIADDAAAYTRLLDPTFDPRSTALLQINPNLPSTTSGVNQQAAITVYAPEQFDIAVETDAPALLTIAQIDYPGWRAELDGQPIPIYRAYGVTSAVVVPAGATSLRLTFDPLTYRIGALISLVSWLGLVILAGWLGWNRLKAGR